MPTYERRPRFDRDLERLTLEQRSAFRRAVGRFVEDLERGEGFRKGLRVKGIRGAAGVFELTWADDGRVTFEFGRSRGEGPHVIWRRVGTHEVFGRP